MDRERELILRTLRRRGVTNIEVIDEGEYNGKPVEIWRMTGPHGEQVFMTSGVRYEKQQELFMVFGKECALDDEAVEIILDVFCGALFDMMEWQDELYDGDCLVTGEPFAERFGYDRLVLLETDTVTVDGEGTYGLSAWVALSQEEEDSVKLIHDYMAHAIDSGIPESAFLIVDAPRKRFMDTM